MWLGSWVLVKLLSRSINQSRQQRKGEVEQVKTAYRELDMRKQIAMFQVCQKQENVSAELPASWGKGEAEIVIAKHCDS